jgi:hypothetical protein
MGGSKWVGKVSKVKKQNNRVGGKEKIKLQKMKN